MEPTPEEITADEEWIDYQLSQTEDCPTCKVRFIYKGHGVWVCYLCGGVEVRK